ncbi:hypothetical protein L6164_028406 [Bauhinia variegata]|uniref:Uncharacterized protein n=2 Tax=Bauhinia variegata TaxID=167791 RepID=A0ACB9L604_BAUVA|nr:hypothetical protein L6164_028404 [Bauhinia variegata]KAI4305015.1 hypothetical protein L6164_028406 [Bauhinia variegata]
MSFRSFLLIPLVVFLLKCAGSAEGRQSGIFLPTELHPDYPGCPAVDSSLYYYPVIGILTHPGDGASGRLSNATGVSYIAASYVKFAEAGGARVIPLIYNEPEETLLKKLELVNGVIFTGGWSKTGSYYETVQKIFKKALEKNDAGNHFPLYGITLGFELLAMIVSEDKNILEKFGSSTKASSLQFIDKANIEGSVFQSFPPDLLKKLTADCLVSQNHKYGLSPEKLQNNEKLAKFFEILTTSIDEEDQVYVSTARARDYPVTAFQWHPQKSAYEWASSSKIPHTEDAVRVTQLVANFLASEARKSTTRPDAQEVRDNLIYNYIPTYGGKAGKGYDQVYIFT